MKTLFKSLVLAATMMFASMGAWAVPVNYQLGFALDASGSISTADYTIVRNGLNSALAGLPDDGTIEIIVVSYGSNATTVVPPTVLTSASLAGIQSLISSHGKDSGGTSTDAALNLLTAEMIGSTNTDASTISAANLTTDGAANSQARAESAAQAMAAAGIGSLSIEAVGRGITSNSGLNNMAQLAFPGPVTRLALDTTAIPNPAGGSWVVPVSSFQAYSAVLNSKVQAATGNPVSEPGVLALFAVGLMGFAFKRRQSKAA